MKTHQAKVINVVQAKTKYGLKLVLNAELLSNGSKVACWSNELGNKVYRSKHKGDIVELIESDKGKFSVLDREPLHASEYSQKDALRNVNGNGLQHISEPLDRVVTDLLDEDDLPTFSDADKKKIMRYIKSQAKLLKYCHDTVCEVFPEIVINDPRGARSLAVTLLINTNQRISKSI